ncbi:MAG: putative transrane protein [Herminiimonas sp.]|nr:putative transrane protein [Herminiimonas sp.]
MVAHKNKTFATFLAFAFGSLGFHRFYLCGLKDTWGWLHFLTLPLSLLLLRTASGSGLMFAWAPLILSAIAAFIEALAIGVTPDEKWDARHNPHSGKQSDSGWLIALLLVLTLGVGATVLIAAIARAFDLLLTGGAYG